MENLGFMFEIKAPGNVTESDFNTLIFQVHLLKLFIENTYGDSVDIQAQNDLIDRMKTTLDNLKITVVGDESNVKD